MLEQCCPDKGCNLVGNCKTAQQGLLPLSKEVAVGRSEVCKAWAVMQHVFRSSSMALGDLQMLPLKLGRMVAASLHQQLVTAASDAGKGFAQPEASDLQ